MDWPLAESCSTGEAGKKERELQFMIMPVLGWKGLKSIQQFFIRFIVALEVFCQKEDSSLRMVGNQLRHSTIPIADL